MVQARGLSVLSPEIQNVNVGAKSYIVGEIPPRIVWVLVQHDVIAVPEPVITKGNISRCNAEVVAAEPEPIGAATTKPPYMMRTEFTREMTVLPRMIEVIVRIAAVVPDPLIIPRINMRRVGMSGPVNVVAVFWG